MVIWRRWIFPILTIIVLSAIAVALGKLAFFADPPPAAEQPSARIADTTVAPERGEIVNALSLPGTVARDDAVSLRSEVNGEIYEIHVVEGQSVGAGALLFTIEQTYPERDIEVFAPESGDITKLDVMEGQPTSIGGELLTLSPSRFHILSEVQPVQLYRLLNAPTEGSVTVQGGPAPFVCTGLRVQVAEDRTTSVRCAIPVDQVVFAGLQATLDIHIGTATDVLTVPATAVKGGAGSGVVWVDAGDALEERPVTLGISDGERVEVTAGLAEGEQIREYVPGLAAPNEPVCFDDGMGGQHCEEQGWNW